MGNAGIAAGSSCAISGVRDNARLGTREDDLLGLEAALGRRLDSDWTARAALRIETRDSSLAEFDYDRELIRITAERLF